MDATTSMSTYCERDFIKFINIPGSTTSNDSNENDISTSSSFMVTNNITFNKTEASITSPMTFTDNDNNKFTCKPTIPNNQKEFVNELATNSSFFYNRLAEECPMLKYIIVHSRRVPDRSEKVPAFWDVWEYLLENTKLPLIANGDFLTPIQINIFWDNYKRFLLLKGLMIARGAQSNPSIFLPFSRNPSEMINIYEVCKLFLSMSKEFAPLSFSHVKFTILQMVPRPTEKYKIGSIVLHSTSWETLCSAFA